MSNPSGSLTIAIRRDGGAAAVTIGSTRPVTAARVFAGMTVQEAAARIPLLFSVCGTAQAAACAAACEQAIEQRADAAVQERRRWLLAAETIREHLWRLLLDWPAALGRTPASAAMAEVMRAYQSLRALLTADAAPFAPGATAVPVDAADGTELAEALTRCALTQVFGHDAGHWQAMVTDADGLRDWASSAGTPAAALVLALLDENLAGLGRNPVQPLPVDAANQQGPMLEGAEADTFVAAPTWRGEPRETTPFARRLAEPLVADLIRRHGNGLLPRLAALLIELAHACTALPAKKGSDPFFEKRGQSPFLALRSGSPADALPAGTGLGVAHAARGLLVHRVVVADGRIAGYRILAPTEWNFHPAGVVAAGLAAIARNGPTEPAELARLARLHITAIDPCVAYQLSVS